ncbi:MAG: GDSL-type esterase/lipase family protein [Bacteroidota bacterium]|nr:GDSL-type esterase/lipase family protein [Bacteroidota bacterium]
MKKLTFFFVFCLCLIITIQAQVITNVQSGKWYGFERVKFNFNGRAAWYVKPAQPAEGNPWVWRAHFPGWHATMDSVLLSRGFFIAYINTNDMYASPAAMRIWDMFYDYLVTQKDFAPKVALEGVSRGGLYVYGWAKRNPSKVACIYAEAPVCDFKSWPGGKGKSRGSAGDWNLLLKCYGFTEEAALAYKDNPLDNLQQLASYKVPVMHVIGLQDSVVPPEENTFLLVNNYTRLGGIATIVPMTRGKKELGGHHFEIENVNRLADFITSNSLPVKHTLDAALFHSIRGGLNNCFIRFQKEKKGRVAFLGGSITENPGWRDKICRYLTERFPDTKFEFIPAGIGSTGSTPGAFRLENDVLSKGQIDLLFEEASVNDNVNGFDDKAKIRGMEGIVRHARQVNPRMDIVLMYFVDPDKIAAYNQGIVPSEIRTHDTVALRYNLPSVNLAKEVTDRIRAGEFTWNDDFKNLHPSPYGQEIYYQSIRGLLEACWKNCDTLQPVRNYPLPKELDKFSYDRGIYLDIHQVKNIRDWKLVDNWKPTDGTGSRRGFSNVPMLIAETPGAELEFSFKGTAVGICVAAGQDAGIIEYSIDNKPYKKQDLFTKWSKQLHIPWYYVLDNELSKGKHSIKIRISQDKNPESNGHACRIVHFLVNGSKA